MPEYNSQIRRNRAEMGPSPESWLSRRRLIGTIVPTVATIAGCLSMGGSGATSVYLVNETTSTKHVTVTVEKSSDHTTRINTTQTIKGGEHQNLTTQTMVVMHHTYTVTVTVDGSTHTYTWKDAVQSLYITIQESGVSFKTRAHPPSSWTPYNGSSSS